jgi:hypothetical protein
MNNLGVSHYKDELVIEGNSVIWSVNDGLIHKRTFNFDSDNQPITQALFTTFSSPPQSNNLQNDTQTIPTRSPLNVDLSPRPTSKALVVILKTLMHIIYLDGGSYIIHLPFPIIRIWSVPLGLLLERQLEPPQTSASIDQSFTLSQSDQSLPRLFTLSSPLEEFGMVTCNRSSLDPDEQILFISSQSDALCVTRNMSENRITLWHASPDQQARRKVLPPNTLLI